MSLSRRDFLKLGGAGIIAAAAATSSLWSLSRGRESTFDYNPAFLHKSNPEHASFLAFNIDNEIRPEIKDVLRVGFEKIAQQASIQSRLNLLEDQPTLDNFNEEIFKQGSEKLIEAFTSLQTTYNHFKNNEPINEENTIAQNEIKKRFYKLALPLSLIYKECQGSITDKDLFAKLYNKYLPINTPAPVDPLIGEEIYDHIGDENWFWDFEMAVNPDTSQLLGTYPCTRKLFFQSGVWLDELAFESGGGFVKSYPKSRPEQGRINQVDYQLYDDVDLVKIPIETEVANAIMLELEKLGLDRSFANMIIRNAGGNEFYGGVVYISRETINHNSDINIFRNSDKLTQEFFDQNKDGIMFITVHEIFHILSGKIMLLNTIDRFKAISKIKKLNLTLNPIFKKEELCDDNIDLESPKNIFEDSDLRLKKFSEATRTIYLIRRLMSDVGQSIWPEVSQIGIYDHYFDKSLSNFINVRTPSDVELSKRFAAAKYSQKYFEAKIEKHYELQKSTMTNLERFVYEELIIRANTTGLYSESIIWYKNEDTLNYYSSTLPMLIMYTSMARGDNRFIDAINADLSETVKIGAITELESKYKFRKILKMSKAIFERNGFHEMNISSPEEFLADQFAYALLEKSEPDLNNFSSGLKAKKLIENSRYDFIELINFYRDRNLANLIANSLA